MRTVKQPAGSKLCFAACVAMVADTTLEDVLAEVQLHPDGWLPLSQAVIFLARRQFFAGFHIGWDDQKFRAVPDTFTYTMPGHIPAIATVKSDAFGGCNHCIVWDQEIKLFRDPNPGYGDTSFPIKYTFREWWPIYKIPPEDYK